MAGETRRERTRFRALRRGWYRAAMQVAVLGAGAWGTALAKVLADKDNPTLLWSHRDDHAKAINEEQVNRRYLPFAKLPPSLRATADLKEALAGAELVVVV